MVSELCFQRKKLGWESQTKWLGDWGRKTKSSFKCESEIKSQRGTNPKWPASHSSATRVSLMMVSCSGQNTSPGARLPWAAFPSSWLPHLLILDATVWMCVPPPSKSHAGMLQPSVMALEGLALGRWVGQRGGASQLGLVLLQKRSQASPEA